MGKWKFQLCLFVMCMFSSCTSSQDVEYRPTPRRTVTPATSNAGGQNPGGVINPPGQIISGQQGQQGQQGTQPSNQSGNIQEALASIKQETLKDMVYYLASDELQGRGTGEKGNDKAAEYIAKKFEEAGLQPGKGSSFMQKFDSSQNVVGFLPGNDPQKKNEVIVIGGHFDHMGNEGGTIYPGADDNASGTSAVVGAAQVLGRLKGQMRRTLVFIAFTGEERGLLGSAKYVQDPIFPIKDTHYMINLDMVGYMDGKSVSLIGGSTSSQAASLLKKAASEHNLSGDLSGSTDGGSDHANFAEKNIPVVFFHTGLHENYHQPSDTADKLNYEGLFAITKMATQFMWELSQDEKTTQMDGFYLKPPSGFPMLDHGIKEFIKNVR